MLAGIPGITDATNKLRTEGTFSTAGDKCFFWPAPSVGLPFFRSSLQGHTTLRSMCSVTLSKMKLRT